MGNDQTFNIQRSTFNSIHDKKRLQTNDWPPSSKRFHGNSTPFNDALECADRNRFLPVHCDNHLSAIHVTPFLMASSLSHTSESVTPQYLDHLGCRADWEALPHYTVNSTSLAFDDLGWPTGSNQRAIASLMFSKASASVSPAEAHPGKPCTTAE